MCEERDVKGLYRRAKKGEIKEFTGISSPYEEPTHPELVINTAAQTIDESVDQILKYLMQRGLFI